MVQAQGWGPHGETFGLVGRVANYNTDKPLTLLHKDAEHNKKVQQYQKWHHEHSPLKKNVVGFCDITKVLFFSYKCRISCILLITIINSSATALQHYVRRLLSGGEESRSVIRFRTGSVRLMPRLVFVPGSRNGSSNPANCRFPHPRSSEEPRSRWSKHPIKVKKQKALTVLTTCHWWFNSPLRGYKTLIRAITSCLCRSIVSISVWVHLFVLWSLSGDSDLPSVPHSPVPCADVLLA